MYLPAAKTITMKRSANQTVINDFFRKTTRFSSIDGAAASVMQLATRAAAEAPVRALTDDAAEEPPAAAQNYLHDVGDYIGDIKKLNDHTKLNLLEHHWTPSKTFSMPFSVRKSHGKDEKRFLQHDHLKQFNFLVYSPSKEGLFCRYCTLFGPCSETGGRGSQQLKGLVTKPFVRYHILIQYAKDHQATEYHKTAMARAQGFREMQAKSSDCAKQQNSSRKQQAEENRNNLIPIVKTIIFCGRQNLALRGHRDDGQLLSQDDDAATAADDGDSDAGHHAGTTNEGNFRALLLFRIDAGDKQLKHHLKTAGQNATYISKTVQNDLINICGTIIQEEIIKEVRAAKFFSILCDETTDTSKKEQITFILRYVCSNKLVEKFLCFVTTEHLTGRALADHILKVMRGTKLDLKYWIGQGYDGASAMKGQFSGVQALIQEEYHLALYVHCSSHCLNLSLSVSCKVQSIRNAHGIIKEITNFINGSAKRVAMMKRSIDEASPDSSRTRIKKLCETRWVERHDAVLTFVNIYDAIILFLEKCDTLDTATAAKARILMTSLISPDFIVGLLCLESVLSVTLRLSTCLQTVGIDLFKSKSMIDNVVNTLQNKRNDTNASFSIIWEKATKMAEKNDIEMKPRRIVSRQSNRENTPHDSASEYFCHTVYIPLLDHILTDMRTRFAPHNTLSFQFSAFIPRFLRNYTFNDALAAIQFYFELLPVVSTQAVAGEYDVWRMLWDKVPQNEQPQTAIDALAFACEEEYPALRCILQIAATLPVTTASAERSFSTLKRLKTYLRSTISQERLNGLAHLYVNNDIDVDPMVVVDRFAQSETKRRLKLIM
jgi:hypothetical protein